MPNSMRRKRNLWVVSEIYYPEKVSTGYVMTQIAEALANDFTVRVLCGRPTYENRSIKVISNEIRNGVGIRRCPSTRLNKDVLLLRLINLITASLSIFVYSIALFAAGDVVLVVTNPPALPFAARFACAVKRARCILLIHDVYPDLAIAVGKLKPGHPAARLLGLASRTLYRSMHYIVVLGRDMKELIESKLDGQEKRVEIIPNWAELDAVHPRPREASQLACRQQLDGKFVALYAGNMGHPQDIEAIVGAAERLRDRSDIHFLFIGSGVKKRWLERAVENKQLVNITIISSLPRKQQVDFLNSCDVGFVSLVKGMKGVSVPSRIYNLMASGKPVVAIVDGQSEVGLMVDEAHFGWRIEPGRADHLAEVLLCAKASPEILKEMGAQARRVAEEQYSLGRVIDRYRALLRSVE